MGMGAVVRAFGQSRSRRLLSVVLALALGLAILVVLPPPPVAAAACGVPLNKIACENTLAGTPEGTWQVTGAGSSNLQGFATDISANLGTTMGFKIDTTLGTFSMDIYRLGYYQGNGAAQDRQPGNDHRHGPARLQVGSCDRVDRLRQLVAERQLDGPLRWGLRHLLRACSTRAPPESQIPFMVRDDSSHWSWSSRPPIRRGRRTTTGAATASTSETRGQRQHAAGVQGQLQPALPHQQRDTGSRLRLERGAADDAVPRVERVQRQLHTGIDTDRFGDLLKNHKAFLSSGTTYWSGRSAPT